MDEKEKFRQRMREMNRRDLEDARAASDAKTLSERADEAVAWYLVNLADLMNRARDEQELEAMLDRGYEQFSLKRIWDQRHKRDP
jgi:hypothetical protein